MGIVHTPQLEPGMTLAEDVRDVNGRLLLNKRSRLEQSHIRIFKIWGITEVNILGNGGVKVKIEPKVTSELIEKTKEETQKIFAHVDLNHPAIKEIFRLSVEYRSCNDVEEKKPVIIPKLKNRSHPDKTNDFLKRLSEKKIILPEISTIVSELNEVIAEPFSSAEDIAYIVNKSPSLTAILLRIVNSALYGCPSKIDKISQAVTLIGTKEIFGLALGISVLSLFKKIPKEIVSMVAFSRHSIACGIISRFLAAHRNLPQTEQLFVSGLLHDLGRVLLYIYLPEGSLTILNNYRQSDKLLYEEEDEYMGCNHTHIVRYLIRHWKLPIALENNVFYHHNPSEAQNSIPASIIHLADIMTNALGVGSSGERFVPPLDYKAWETLDLPTSCFEVVLKQAIHQLDSFETILYD